MYMGMAAFNYFFVFDQRLMRHPLFQRNQVRLEIAYASKSMLVMAIFTVPLFVLELHGYSRLYMDQSTGLAEIGFIGLSIVSFLMFTDCAIYWIHRFLHLKYLYKYLHKAHHCWKVPSPFASHAFHPLTWAAS